MKRKYTQAEVDRLLSGTSGRIYINPDDLNLFVTVRRPGRYAVIPNLGNRWSWLIIAVIALAAVLIASIF